MRVYRVEHITYRCGPFSNYAVLRTNAWRDYQALMDAQSLMWWNGPAVLEDCAITWVDYYTEHHTRRVACDSIAQLLRWFDRALTVLEAANYICAVYETDDILSGKHQVFANLTEPVDYILLSDLLTDEAE